MTPAVARAVVGGDVSALVVASGWPHADTSDAMATAAADGAGPAWLITRDGAVIGDCGAFRWPERSGTVEIGYGLAAPSRHQGFGTEAIAAVCRWLVAEAGATRITATTAGDNEASRRLLERLGFVVTGGGGGDDDVSYELTAARLGGRSAAGPGRIEPGRSAALPSAHDTQPLSPSA